MTDMDNLVTIHEEFMSKIIKLCLLDGKSKNFLELILNILQVTLDFRVLVKKYLIPSCSLGNRDEDDSDNENPTDKSSCLFDLESLQFMDKYKECRRELDILKEKHTLRMKHLIQGLNKYTKKGIFNYLNEAFIRFNFNQYYIGREHEE
jgi:hypothetical protein